MLSPQFSLFDDAEELQEAKAAAPPSGTVCTSYYAVAKPEMGVLVQASVGRPRFFKHAMEVAEILAPWGILGTTDDKEAYRRLYLARMDDHREEVIQTILDIQRRHPGQRVVILCYENIRKPGQWCHRRIFAEWWLKNTGETVDEL